MYAIKNKVQLWGQLTADPEFQQLANGINKVHILLVTTESFINRMGEDQTDIQCHQLIGWQEIAVSVNLHLKKGMLIAVEGKLQTRNFTDTCGIYRTITEIAIKQFKVIGNNGPKRLTAP